MVDCKGNEINIGDYVCFIRGKNTDCSLDVGYVTKVYKGCFNRDECSVGSHTHIRSTRVMLLMRSNLPIK